MSRKFPRTLTAIAALTALNGCSDPTDIPGFNALEKQVEGQRVGRDTDRWIEMRNDAGEWERTGLIFGYADDGEECAKAIAGLSRTNEAREYRCAAAN